MADKKSEMFAMLAEEQEIREKRIIAEKDGAVYVDFHDAAVLNSANSYEGDADTGMRKYNPDGSLAASRKRVVALNPDFYFMNRYKVKGAGANKKMLVVSGHTPEGFRCIKEQSSGRCHIKTIPVYVLSRDESKNLVLDKQTTVTESEFISDFKDTLSNNLMAEVLPLIAEAGADTKAATEMPI